ncbi:HAD family hydrolase [Rhizobium pusense]|uniref:phosphoribosyltransferase family protein n=1 Tax=Agrobacterium pusense TaxID=648995 RepID=UPI001C6E181C|nr:phosphoribosyltransferase family protein [Agrobacterium pusense]MBW9080672.1 HAD family hydrolase [Agrobacterium pusense]
MYTLKGAIFSLRDTLVVEGAIDATLMDQTVKLLQFLLAKNITPVIVSNSSWIATPSKREIPDLLSEAVGYKIPYFQGGRDMPMKQFAGAMNHVLATQGWQPEEAIYIGSTREDMIAARNGKLMFLNARWHAQNSAYGFEFESPKDIARFIDCCCLAIGDWFWAIEQADLRVYAIAPLAEYSKSYPTAGAYSTDAKQAVKFNKGDLRFWGRLMGARLYFSGLGRTIDYVAPYPGHRPDSAQKVLSNALKIAADTLRSSYLVDLIERHSPAQKSQTARQLGIALDHENQLSTIRLRRDPLKTGQGGGRYKSSPLKPGKTVLVVDDILTEGFSLEAAQAFVKATGASVICAAWLKTPGANHYRALAGVSPDLKDPYKPFTPAATHTNVFPNGAQIRNAKAPEEVAEAFKRYSAWDWP